MNPIHIFLAGQDPQERTFLDHGLAEAGIQAKLKYFETGAGLLKGLETTVQKPEVIFLDMDTLKIRGMVALSELRKMETCKNIPIIMFSTTSYLDDINLAFNNGANLFVPKPVFIRDKATAIETIFSINWRKTLLIKDRILFVLNAATSFMKLNRKQLTRPPML
ncbi:MAG TPA: response regulator [Flavobacteriales bacterium]|nr:response regulator [Flavobacteriales bacterium]